MSAISKDDVLNLREKTGAGLIDCKRALVESNGDLDEAVLDRNVRFILDVVFRSLTANDHLRTDSPDLPANARHARQAAADGVVLLKNASATLPISANARVAACILCRD